MTKQPGWFTQLERDLNASVMVPDGAAIDWDQCRDRFLVPLLQRLEEQSSSPHPAILRRLLQRRLAEDDVTAELSAAFANCAAADCAAAAGWTDWAGAFAAFAAFAVAFAVSWTGWASASADWAVADAVRRATDWAVADAVRRVAGRAIDTATTGGVAAAAAAAERAAQQADLRAAVAASSQQPALPDGYIVPTPVDLAALHDPTFSAGLTATQHVALLRGGPDPRLPAPPQPPTPGAEPSTPPAAAP